MSNKDRKWDRLHDAILEYTGFSLNDEQCDTVFKMLPLSSQNEAETWGYNDTVFGDKVCEFAIENKDKIAYIVAK